MTIPDNFAKLLATHAEHLNSIDTPADSTTVCYDCMAGALLWSDEANEQTSWDLIGPLRFIIAYRTSLMLNEPREKLKPIWDLGLSLFPKWVGFRLERRKATPELLAIYRRGDVSLRACLRKLEQSAE